MPTINNQTWPILVNMPTLSAFVVPLIKITLVCPSFSLLLTGSDRLSQTLRQQCAAELCVNAVSYAKHDLLDVQAMSESPFGNAVATQFVLPMNSASLNDKARVVKDEAKLVLNGGEPSLLQAAALATVIKRSVHSLCLDQVSEECLIRMTYE